MADSERALKAIARRYNARKAALEQAERERDEAIRATRGEVTGPRIAEIFGLSIQRVKQLRRPAGKV